MPSTETLYICDICGNGYVTEQEAIDCEDLHQEAITISKVKYNCGTKYPRELTVAFKNGESRTYKL